MASSNDVLATVFRLTDKTAGRDKICRLVQYGAKFVYWALEIEGLSPQLVSKLKGLESSISTARKLFRLGKSVDNFRGAFQTIHLGEPMLRTLVTLVKLNRGIYLLYDHVLWAARMNLVVIDNKYWVTYSNRFWLFSIVLCLIRDCYEILKCFRAERQRLESASGGQIVGVSMGQSLHKVFVNNPTVTIDLIKNVSDFFIPAARLDLVGVPEGVIGLMGVVSSIAGLVVACNDNLKLKFS